MNWNTQFTSLLFYLPITQHYICLSVADGISSVALSPDPTKVRFLIPLESFQWKLFCLSLNGIVNGNFHCTQVTKVLHVCPSLKLLSLSPGCSACLNLANILASTLVSLIESYELIGIDQLGVFLIVHRPKHLANFADLCLVDIVRCLVER